MSWTFVGVLFLIYYTLVPRANKVLRHSVVMSLSIGGLFVLLNKGFALFLSTVTAVNPIYGAFGGVLGFLVWVFLSFVLLLLGARTLFYLEKQAEIETRAT
jgi:membrane protein